MKKCPMCGQHAAPKQSDEAEELEHAEAEEGEDPELAMMDEALAELDGEFEGRDAKRLSSRKAPDVTISVSAGRRPKRDEDEA